MRRSEGEKLASFWGALEGQKEKNWKFLGSIRWSEGERQIVSGKHERVVRK